ncbi:uridine kinase [Microbacterium sp.]|uniref:uridine kinase n=1 Tax=Microbacterium sp. TaxID=51671 RepID=UPI002812172F|nr:uridine kinase [Microbacterium sp.]
MDAANTREEVVSRLWSELQQVRPDDRALIALDGYDGVGKTRLAQELVELATVHGARPLARVSIDGFHRPKAERRRAGSGPEGFYRGSYRYDAFWECVITPLRRGEAITPAVWDVARDRPVAPSRFIVPPRGILIVDGIFLQRSELVDAWDATVWVDAPFAVSVPRGNGRFPGSHDPDPDAPSNRRYVGGQRLYVAEAAPEKRATWVFDNTELDRPTLRRVDR